MKCFTTSLLRRLVLAATLVPATPGCGGCDVIDDDRTSCVPPPNGGVCKSPDDPSLLQDLGVNDAEVKEALPPTASGDCCYIVTTHMTQCDGRPLRIGGGLVVAPAALGQRGWQEPETTPDVRALSSAARAALAQHWTRAALTEHASIASFARASLELMAVGAPAWLVDAAHAAAREEVHHARLCFALASAYEESTIAPGPLPLGDAIPLEGDLASIARATMRDGCVNETLAALVGAARLSRAEEPAVREVLAVIVEDEARHAELAWKTVRWAINTGGAPVRDAVQKALAEALRNAEEVLLAEAEAMTDGSLASHGLLTEDEVRKVVVEGLSKVVLPCAKAMLGAAPQVEETVS